MPERYHYQTIIYDTFLESKADLLIQAPTGAGKTRASLEPGVQGLYRNTTYSGAGHYPPRIVYGVPMRVLANSFVTEYQNTAKRMKWQPEWNPTIQTGEHPEDEQFEGRLIFATVDQMLASFLGLPYGLPGRLGNINTGALIGSYLIFDEFHLFPRSEMMLSVLAMLKMLKGISRFTLMTATFSRPLLKSIADLLEAQIIADDENIPLSDGLFHDITRLRTQQRTWFTHRDAELTASVVADIIGDRERTTCICNTVDHAQTLTRNLKAHLPDHEIVLLHSRFYREHRQHWEHIALERLGSEDDSRPMLDRPFILVATQVVEVGLDISCDVLLTECAPAASLIQRAGRCARNPDEQGDVHVFQPRDEDGNISYAPYLDGDQEAICHETWATLASAAFNGKVLRFPEEQALINAAHGAPDAAFVDGLMGKVNTRIKKMTDCMAKPAPGYLGDFIRENTSVPLYVNEAPWKTLDEKPWRNESFSLSKGQLARLYEVNLATDADFVLMGGVEQRVVDPELPFAKTVYQWEPLREPKEVYGSTWQFAAHPLAVSYSREMGLQLRPGTYMDEPETRPRGKAWERPYYHAERYEEHIAGLYLAYTQPRHLQGAFRTPLYEELVYPLRRVCERLGLDAGEVERLFRFALATHDVGKLNRDWQAWARAWQAYRMEKGLAVGIPLDDPTPLAHTDFDSDSPYERELQKSLPHKARGTHAVESAEAVALLLQQLVGSNRNLGAVILSIIMHHHTPSAAEGGAFDMVNGGHESLAASLRAVSLDDTLASQIVPTFTKTNLHQAPQAIAPSYKSYDWALLYYVLVRTLRLADQRSGRWWQRYKDEMINPLNKEVT
ncbi:MAG: CRISPR-associated helicase Cas3' [Chloroflexi bacterium]|nr:CRISPR-associated helicase Cas3' [Chloroflexota bacterium]